MNTGAELYLDTARLGRMRKSAQWAVRDFARLAGEATLTLYGTNFLLHGFEALSEQQRRRCPRLEAWGGIAQLKQHLLDYVDAGAEQECLLASRSVSLIRLGALIIARRYRRVLIPDLWWRPYAATVRAIAETHGRHVIPLNVRREVFTHEESAEDLTERICDAFAASACDSACLPAVTHDGIKLPIEAIADRLRSQFPSAFIMVDAAQGIGHVPTGLGVNSADLVVAGVHKWLGGGLPLGVGFGRPELVSELSQSSQDDPLLILTGRAGIERSAETVNLWPLISCNAVLANPTSSRIRVKGALATRFSNRRSLLQTIRGRDWTPSLTHPSLRAGILLLSHNPGRRQRRKVSADVWRAHFQKFGIALSSYPGSLIRLSLPAKKMSTCDLAQLASAL